MDKDIECDVVIDGVACDARVLFETEEIVVRGAQRAVIPLRKLKSAEMAGGALLLSWDEHSVSLDLGEATANKWLEKIRNPKSRLDKIGVKEGQRISAIGVADPDLIGELTARGADVSTRLRSGSDIIFFGANDAADLARLPRVRESLAPAGALWIIRPKGVKTITEAGTMAAGKAAGLVDVKVVKFSETHTAEKFVIPVSRR